MINTANEINDRPSAIRYPRGEAKEEVNFDDDEILQIGKGKIVKEGKKIAIIAYGTIIENVFKADEQENLNLTISDARFAKPIDKDLVKKLATTHEILITIEEGTIGGFGSVVSQFLQDSNLIDQKNFKFRSMFMRDKFIEHNKIDVMQEEAGIGVKSIVDLIKSFK